jgi:hypothetical protein
LGERRKRCGRGRRCRRWNSRHTGTTPRHHLTGSKVTRCPRTNRVSTGWASCTGPPARNACAWFRGRRCDRWALRWRSTLRPATTRTVRWAVEDLTWLAWRWTADSEWSWCGCWGCAAERTCAASIDCETRTESVHDASVRALSHTRPIVAAEPASAERGRGYWCQRVRDAGADIGDDFTGSLHEVLRTAGAGRTRSRHRTIAFARDWNTRPV